MAPSRRRAASTAIALLLAGAGVLGSAVLAPISTRALASGLEISEFRLRGPAGPNDEFIEIMNASLSARTVVAAAGTGFAVAASDGVTRCTIPNGTVIPVFGHYLCVNNNAAGGYSLGGYPGGSGTATGDATYTLDIPDNAGIALFNNSIGGTSFTAANEMDAVGSSAEANALYREGTGYPPLTTNTLDYSLFRNLWTTSVSNAESFSSSPGVPEDNGNNASDFAFVDPTGADAGAGARLGAPGPENSGAPLGAQGVSINLLDPCVGPESAPNAVRNVTSDPANLSTAGTLDLRRTITNTTGAPLTRLRLRVTDVRTYPAAPPVADTRVRTSASLGGISVGRPACGTSSTVTVQGTTLEQPPLQPGNGGFNSSLSVPSVTPGTPLANGGSVDVRVLVGVQRNGTDAVNVLPEALPGRTDNPPGVQCLGMTVAGDVTDGCPPVQPVSIAESFAAPTIPLNGSTTLTFTITNLDPAVDATGIKFTDALPPGLVVANPSAQSGGCGAGTVTAVAGASTVTLVNGAIAPTGYCTFQFDVTGVTAGAKDNAVQVTGGNTGLGNTAAASVAVVAPPVTATSFGASGIPVNGSTTVSFTITNPNTATALSGIGFTDALPGGMVVATPAGLAGACGGGTITATAAATSVSLAGASLPAGGSCTFSAGVTGTTMGGKDNAVQSTSTNGGTGNTAVAFVVVTAPPTITKSFGVAAAPVNGTVTLTFAVTNPNIIGAPSTAVAFTDTLPAGVVVATPGVTGSCGGGTITAVQGTSSVALAGASLATGATCTFSVAVTGTTVGAKNNVTGTVSSTEGGTGGTASASYSVVLPPSVTTGFGSASIPQNSTTSLSVTITNPNPSDALHGVALTDLLPAGLHVAAPNGISGSCGGGTITAASGSGTVALSGATLAPAAGCSFSVVVAGTAPGAQDNAVQVTSTDGGVGNASHASVTVVAPPGIAKSFGAATAPLNGSTSLSFTLTNPNVGTALSGVAFTDALPGGVVVATPNGVSGSCGGGTLTAPVAAGSIVLGNANLPANGSCSFAVDVTGTSAGLKSNATTAVTSIEGGTGGTATASYSVVAPPAIAMAFGTGSIPQYSTTTLTFTLSSPPSNTVGLTGVAFADTLPTGVLVATPNGITGTCAGTASAVAGSGGVSLSGVAIAPGAGCTFAVSVVGTAAGTHVNTSGVASSTNGGLGTTSSASLVVVDAVPVVTVPGFAATEKFAHNGTVATFADPDPSSSPGHYIATVDWGDGTTLDTGAITGGSGAFAVMVPGGHAYDFGAGGSGNVVTKTVTVTVHDISDPAGIATGSGTAAVTDLSDNDSWLLAMYRDLLGRDPDASGQSYWHGVLARGGARDGVARTVANGDEARAIFITAYYQAFLSRPADAGGMSGCLRLLQSGATLQDVQAAILSSSEFLAKHGGANAGFVDALYTTFLGRTADAGGRNYWLTVLAGGTLTRGDVAYAFLRSSEYLGKLVNDIYLTYQRRPVDAGGSAYLAGRLNAGVRIEDMIAGLIASTEYFDRAQ